MATPYDIPQNFSTTLNVGGGITNSQTTGIILTSVTNLPTDGGILCFDWASTLDTSVCEYIEYTGISGNELTGVTRGQEGISAHAHSNGATVVGVVSRAHIKRLRDKLTGNDATAIQDPNGNEILKTSYNASAVNEITITNAATGSGPSIAPTGGDTNIPLIIKGKGSSNVQVSDGSDNELLKFTTTSSAVNELTLANAATGNAPSISATGTDSNISINLVPKGTGTVQVSGSPILSVSTAWTAFTPTFSGSGGSAGSFAQDLVVARYTTIGKLVYFTIHVRITNKGSWSGSVQLALPVTASTNLSDKALFPVFWTAQGSNPVTATRGQAVTATTTVMNFKDSINTSVLGWASVTNNDTVFGQGFYEID